MKSLFEVMRGMLRSVFHVQWGIHYLLTSGNEMCKYVCGSKNCELLMRDVSFE